MIGASDNSQFSRSENKLMSSELEQVPSLEGGFRNDFALRISNAEGKRDSPTNSDKPKRYSF